MQSCVVVLLAFVAAVSGRVLWECDSFPSGAPLEGCNWERSHVHWEEENGEGVPDPAGRPGNVLRVFYKQGSWVTNDDNKGGFQFYSAPFPAGDERTLEYEVYFSPNFDYVQGGKLPGFFGGTGKCSGGDHGETCFSTRYMWRTDGDGEVYGYIPNETDDWFCDLPDVVCDPVYGHSFGRGTWRFSPGRWYTISQTIKLNQVGSKDASITVNVDGQQVYQISGLTFRTTSELQVDQIYFSTFFGGSSSAWASTRDVYSYFRNFKVMD